MRKYVERSSEIFLLFRTKDKRWYNEIDWKMSDNFSFIMWYFIEIFYGGNIAVRIFWQICKRIEWNQEVQQTIGQVAIIIIFETYPWICFVLRLWGGFIIPILQYEQIHERIKWRTGTLQKVNKMLQ